MARYALVIGIARYEHLRSLPKAAVDAEAIAQILENQYLYRVTRLPRKASEVDEARFVVAPHKHLSRKRLSQELNDFFRQRARNHDVVVYIAGHGLCVEDDLNGELTRYLALSDSDENGNNAIVFNTLSQFIGESDLSSLVMLIDCCYAGELIKPKQFLEPATSQIVSEQRDACLIAACRDFERAREGEKHGIFTAAVLEGLKAENSINGETTSSYLHSSIERQLSASGQEVTHSSTGRDIILFRHHQPVPRVGIVSDVCPYQGLKPFECDTAEFFFGRDRLVKQLINQLERSHFIPVIGASGSGKSSVVKAGLIPKLTAQGWQILPVIQPGHNPIGNLKQAIESYLRSQQELHRMSDIAASIDAGDMSCLDEQLAGDDRILIFVDQFEEVFALCSKEGDRAAFIRLLTQVTSQTKRLFVVMTMRADFFEECLSYGTLAEIIESRQILAKPMSESEWTQAIVEPANRQGYQIGEGLLELILRDIEAEKNCLPLLQFALTELWERRDTETRCLRAAQYQTIGGLTGALNLYAEKLYVELTESQRDWVKRICLQLVRTSNELRDTRQQRAKQELLSMQQNAEEIQMDISQVLQKLVDRRLLVTDTNTHSGEAQIDLAHEALMNGWKRFAEWRQEDRELRRLRDRINDEFNEWLTHGKGNEFLMAGGRLTQISRRWQELKVELSIEAQEFYNLSHLNEQATSLFQANIDEFKASLDELQIELSGRVAAIGLEIGNDNNNEDQSQTGAFRGSGGGGVGK